MGSGQQPGVHTADGGPHALSFASLAGISRSTTIVVAYVMAVTEMSSQEVLEAIRSMRPVANPNPGFKQQLEEFSGSAARKVGCRTAQGQCIRSLPCAPCVQAWIHTDTGMLLCFSLFPQMRRHLKQRYGTSPFNDEEEIKALLPAGRGRASQAEGARQGLVPRARDIKSTAPFLLRVKRTFSCIPACLK